MIFYQNLQFFKFLHSGEQNSLYGIVDLFLLLLIQFILKIQNSVFFLSFTQYCNVYLNLFFFFSIKKEVTIIERFLN